MIEAHLGFLVFSWLFRVFLEVLIFLIGFVIVFCGKFHRSIFTELVVGDIQSIVFSLSWFFLILIHAIPPFKVSLAKKGEVYSLVLPVDK